MNSYTYNSTNQLMVHQSGGMVNSLYYEPSSGMLSSINANAGPNMIDTRFAWSGPELLLERSGSSGAILRRYVHGAGSDDPIVWYEGSGINSSTRRFLMADERGSVVSVTDSAGSTIGINSYDEYGIPAPTNVGRFGYTGQMWLPELKLWYYKARIYSPTLGRFLQTDPIGNKDGINWYAYVGNDPVNNVDPDGKCKNRDSSGECIVTNNAGKEGETTADQLQRAVRETDKAISAVEDDSTVSVTIDGEDSTMSGKQLKATWAATTWTVNPKGTVYANGYGAEMTSEGAFAGNVDYLDAYRESASARGKDPNSATSSVVKHDFTHNTRVGQDIMRRHSENFDTRERSTSNAASQIFKQIGSDFECSTFDLGC